MQWKKTTTGAGGEDEYKRVGGHKTGDVGGHYKDYEMDEGDYLNEDKIELDLGDFEMPEDVQLVARLIQDDEEEELGDED